MPRSDTKYTVEWRVEVYAASPEQAAKLARCIQLGLKGQPMAFSVRGEHQKAVQVSVEF